MIDKYEIRLGVWECERGLGYQSYGDGWYIVFLSTASALGMVVLHGRTLEMQVILDNYVPTITWNSPKWYEVKVRMKFEVTSEQRKASVLTKEKSMWKEPQPSPLVSLRGPEPSFSLRWTGPPLALKVMQGCLLLVASVTSSDVESALSLGRPESRNRLCAPSGCQNAAHEAPAAWFGLWFGHRSIRGRILELNSSSVWNGDLDWTMCRLQVSIGFRSTRWTDSYTPLDVFPAKSPAIICTQQTLTIGLKWCLSLLTSFFLQSLAQYLQASLGEIIWNTYTLIWTLVHAKDTSCSHAYLHSHFSKGTKCPHH